MAAIMRVLEADIDIKLREQLLVGGWGGWSSTERGLQLVCSEPNTDAMISRDVTGHFAFGAQKNT